MRPRSAAIIACRVIAIVFATEALTAAISLIATTAQFGQSGSASLWAAIVTRAVIAILLWIQAVPIADAIVRGTVDEGPASPMRAMSSHAIAFSVVGVVFTVNAIVGLVATATSTLEFSGFAPLSRFPFTPFA